MSGASYFTPTITISADNIIDHSQMVGIVPILLMPENVERIGFMIQNLSRTNDLWWGYDNNVTVNGLGCFCLRAAADDKKSSIFMPPPQGIWRGPIYGLSDGGSRVTLKEWKQV